MQCVGCLLRCRPAALPIHALPADRLAVQAEYHDVLFEVLLYAFGDK